MNNISPLTGALKNNLLALSRTQKLVDRTTERLATGLKVGSALDNPNNFFTAQALEFRASDLSNRLDGIGKSIRTIKQASHGTEAILKLLRQAEIIAEEELERISESGDIIISVASTEPPLSDLITASNPVSYWELNDTSGTTAISQGSIGPAVNGAYQNSPTLSAAPLHSGSSASVDFNGVNQSVSIPDHPDINTSPQTERTVELVFNAIDTTGRQVLYEEGATVNGLTIYIDNGNLYVNGRDAGEWGPVNISAPINAGQTYHAAFTLDSVAGEFIGYLNGVEIGRDTVTATFPSHSGDIGIGRMNESAWFHDGAQSGNGFYFGGRISDVAVYNDVLTPADMVARANSIFSTDREIGGQNEEFNKVLDQITQIAWDSSYLGISLLDDEDLTTLFNEDGSHSLLTEGVDFTAQGLGIKYVGFNIKSRIEEILESVRTALMEVRDHGFTLQNDLNILKIRNDFTNDLINTLESGAQDLTIADMNEEGANLIALQTRQALGITSLSLAADSSQSPLRLFA